MLRSVGDQMRAISGCPAAALLTAAVIFSSGWLAAQDGETDWGAKVGQGLRTAWNVSRQPGGALLSSVKTKGNIARVLVVFDGPPQPLPGFRMMGSGGNVAAGLLDLDYLPQLASASNVRYIRSERIYYPNDDPGVLSVRAPRTRTRLGITGRNVLLGVVDTGIDWDHPDFLDSGGNSRIEAVLDLSEPPDSLADGDLGEAGPYGGIVVYRQMIDAALAGQGTIREKDFVGHGTHVAGTAAASASPDTINSLGGVAPGAMLVGIKATSTPRDSSFSDFNILNGIAFLDSLAFFRGLPWVANLSLGSVLGSHDGTDPLEIFLARFVRNPQRGKAIVVSSGNSRNKALHSSGNFATAGTDSMVLELNLTGGQAGDDYVAMEIWLYPGVKFDIYAPDSTLLGSLADGDTLVEVTDHGVLFVENARGGAHPLAGGRLISCTITDLGATNQDTADGNIHLSTGTWRFVLHSDTGSWDAYVTSNYGLGSRFSSHVVETGTVNVPGTSPDLITVGAYNARTGWWSLSGGAGSLGANLGTYAPGTLTYFSSLGPTRDGRMKPEITAPGRWVLGSLSRDSWPLDEPLSIFASPYSVYPQLLIATDSVHAASQGTSFSAPHVAGVVALLLEVDPTLTNARIRYILTSTAATDSQTVDAPDNFWGYGRVNAAGAVAEALGIETDTVRLTARADPPDTVRTDTLRYTVTADFSGSLQAVEHFRIRVSWPPQSLRVREPLDTLIAGGSVVLSPDTDSLSEGVLTFKGRVSGVPPDSVVLVTAEFGAVSLAEADNVLIRCDVLEMSGDLAGGSILSSLAVSQAGSVSLRVKDICLLAGDLDSNGVVNVFDLLELLKVITGKREQSLCSDLDANGGTDIFDLLELLRKMKND
ncbi:MAG: S8 family serine peptidase [Candidatus Glassbacteria bacterium]|nr:S8 family serine peptidase [Candidatus Glassbacteria bacterium]